MIQIGQIYRDDDMYLILAQIDYGSVVFVSLNTGNRYFGETKVEYVDNITIEEFNRIKTSNKVTLIAENFNSFLNMIHEYKYTFKESI
jgi:hypothetical protein